MIKNSNFACLCNKLDPFVRESFLQFVEGHKLIEVISSFELQLLNANVWLALVHGTRLEIHA